MLYVLAQCELLFAAVMTLFPHWDQWFHIKSTALDLLMLHVVVLGLGKPDNSKRT